MRSDRSNIIIANAQPADEVTTAEVRAMWQTCFHDTDAFTDYYLDMYYQENQVLTLKKEDKTTGMMHLNPYTISWRGQKVDTAYIVGVATDPGYRHQGIMTQLMEEFFRQYYDQKIPFTYLMPADKAIYTPLQFEYIYNQQIINLPSDEVEYPCPEGIQKKLSVRLASAGDFGAMAALADKKLAASATVYTFRDVHYYERLWQEVQTDGGDIVLFTENNELCGYIIYAMEERVEVREICGEDSFYPAAFRWMKKYFADKRCEVLGIFPEYLRLPLRTRPVIMARIIHLKSFMQLASQPGDYTVTLRVTDRWIGENQGNYRWKVTGRHVSFEKIVLKEPVMLEIGIEHLVQWLSGYKTITALAEEKRVQVFGALTESLSHIPVKNNVFINEII